MWVDYILYIVHSLKVWKTTCSGTVEPLSQVWLGGNLGKLQLDPLVVDGQVEVLIHCLPSEIHHTTTG